MNAIRGFFSRVSKIAPTNIVAAQRSQANLFPLPRSKQGHNIQLFKFEKKRENYFNSNQIRPGVIEENKPKLFKVLEDPLNSQVNADLYSLLPVITDLIKVDPSPDLFVLRSAIRARQGDFEAALDDLKAALNNGPLTSTHRFILEGRSLFKEFYELAIKRFPNEAVLHGLLGKLLIPIDLNAARSALRLSVKLDPNGAAVWNSLSHVEYDLENYSEALNALDQVQNFFRKPGYIPFGSYYPYDFFKHKPLSDESKIIHMLKNVANISSDNLNDVMFAFVLNNPNEVTRKEILDLMHENHRANRGICSQVAYWLLAYQKNEHDMDLFLQDLKDKYGLEDFMDMIGVYNREKHKIPENITDFPEQWRIEVWRSRAQALETLNKYDEAVSTYEYVLNKQPYHPSALEELIQLYVNLNQWDNAKKLVPRLREVIPKQDQYFQEKALKLCDQVDGYPCTIT